MSAGAIRMRFRADVRRRWLAFVALGLLAGLAGGVVLTAVAGARRTDSALPRFLHHARSADVLANPDNDPGPHWDDVDRLPEVADVGSLKGIAVERIVDGRLDASWLMTLLGGVTDTHLFRTLQRERVVQGRMFDPDAVDEVVVNEHMAKQRHLHVGSRVHLTSFDQTELRRLMTNRGRPRGTDVSFTVVGVMAPLDDIVRAPDDPRLGSSMLFTPAFMRESNVGVLYAGKYVRLKDRSLLPAFERDVRRLVGSDVNFEETATTETRVDRAVRPYVFALWVFAGLAAIVGGLVVAQTIARQHRIDARDDPTLLALGFSQRDLRIVGALRGAAIGLVGAGVAVVVAYLGSNAMPIGPLRRVEPVPGRQVDVVVFALGALAIVALTTLHGAFSGAWQRARQPSPRRRGEFQLGMPAPLQTGVRFALDRGQGRARVPLRSTLLGITLAIAALVASMTYADALSHFTSTPRLYGWVWDYQIEPEDQPPPQVAHVLDSMRDISWTRGAYAQLDFGRASVAAIAIAPKSGISTVDVVRGRAPNAVDEVVLGAKSMRLLHAHVGSVVRARSGAGRTYPLHVVGQAVFARFAAYPASDPTGLGTGAAVTLAGLKHMDHDGTLGVGSPFFLVRAHDGAHIDAKTLQAKVFPNYGPTSGSVYGAQRPNDVLSYERLERTPLLLAALLVLLGAATTVHLLVTGVRRRRRDLGLLKAIGCTVRQLLSIVLVQATTLVLLTLVVAVPVGIIAGRAAWVLTAHWLGIPADPVVPGAVIFGVVIVALIVGNLVAFAPGLAAGRTRAAVALRAE